MTALRPLAAATLLALAFRAAAGDWSGFADTGLIQNDVWSGPFHDRQPAWDFGGQLAVSGAPLRPGLLSVSASGTYRQTRSQYAQSSSRSDNYGYAGSANLLSEKPLSLTLGASRSWSDFATDATTRTTGATLARTESASANYNAERFPSLRASLMRTEFENHSFAAPTTIGQSTSLSLGATQVLPAHSYGLSYDTSWNDGSFSETNYRSHFVTLQASSRVSGDTDVRFTERYFLRAPTLLADTNPRFDDNAFGASVTWRASPRIQSVTDYGYRHLVVDLPFAADRESIGHTIGTGAEYRWSDTITLGTSLAGNYGLDRLETRQVEIAGESVGASARWQRAVGRDSFYAGANGSVGGQQQDGTSQFAYGVGATTGTTRVWSRLTGTLSYGGGYASNLGTNLGWSVQHQLSAQLEGASPLGGRMREILSASQARRGNPLFGDSRSETVSAVIGNSWRTRDLQLNAGLSNGAATTIASPIGGDFVLPTHLHTQTRYVTLTGTAMAWGVSWSALARYLETTSPGRPKQFEEGLGLVTGYRLGAFTFTVEDRYTIGGAGTVSQHGNVFMARLSRSLGGTF